MHCKLQPKSLYCSVSFFLLMSAYAIEIFSLNVTTGIQQVYQSLVGLRVKTTLLKGRLHSKP